MSQASSWRISFEVRVNMSKQIAQDEEVTTDMHDIPRFIEFERISKDTAYCVRYCISTGKVKGILRSEKIIWINP